MPYELYEKMLAASRDHNEDLVAVVGSNLLAQKLDNPFQQNTKEHELYFTASLYYTRWRNNGIDARSSRRRMAEALNKLAALNVPNPYSQPAQERPAKEDLFIEPEIKVDTDDLKIDELQKKVDELKAEGHVFEQAPQDAILVEAAEHQPTAKVVNEQPEHVLGVIPEKKNKRRFWQNKETPEE